MSESPQHVYIMAGPNGAGKTTFVECYLNRYIACDEFLNADMIAKGLSPFAPERQSLLASQIFLERLGTLELGTVSFALETTLSGLSYRQRIASWKQLGFSVTLFYLWLPSEGMAIDRVATRVSQGGHNIPVSDIQRRYQRSLRNLVCIYLPIVDDAWVLNGAINPPEIIWRRVGGDEQTLDAAIWDFLNSKAKGGS